MAISVNPEAHVMVLHTTLKFVMATPTSVTHGQTDNKILIYYDDYKCFITNKSIFNSQGHVYYIKS